MTFRDLKSFGARLSDLSRTLAGDPKMRVSDLKLSTLNVQLPVPARMSHNPFYKLRNVNLDLFPICNFLRISSGRKLQG